MLKTTENRMKNKQKNPTLTSAPMTPKLVNRKNSNVVLFTFIFKNGYKKNGI